LLRLRGAQHRERNAAIPRLYPPRFAAAQKIPQRHEKEGLPVKTPSVDQFPAPDARPLTKSQIARLSAVSGLDPKELADLPPAEIQAKFRWRIDPDLLLFRRICGRVVKKDPATGVEYVVPNATVHVEDTDCNLLVFSPAGYDWCWFFPFHCHREEIATVKTDACGRFCVWIPRFEIDWILRWRRERICFALVFLRPSILEILDHLTLETDPPQLKPRWPRPGPGPDPGPILERLSPNVLQRVESFLGKGITARIAEIGAAATFGGTGALQDRLLSQPAFPEGLRPPLPAEFQKVAAPSQEGVRNGAVSTEIRSTLAARVHLPESALNTIDLNHYTGPFWRCFDVFVPEWAPVFDVPDITFRVTQDVDGDGDEETIYGESYFQVRWDSGPIPDVTLHAWSNAVAFYTCDPPAVPCGDVPAILFAGLMPLVNPAAPEDPFVDLTAGYARRPNRPHPSGDYFDPLPNPLAATPFCRTLQLYGCSAVGSAAYYRVRYAYNGGSPVPFTGITWPLYRVVGGVLQTQWAAADAAGWYPIVNPADNWSPPNLLLEWATPGYVNGFYKLDLQIANAGKAVLATSLEVGLRTDNSHPLAQFMSLRWRAVGGVWHDLPLICPVISRGMPPADLEIEVTYRVMASHLRSFSLEAYGCGAGVPVRTSALASVQHWHTTPADNAGVRTATFGIAAAAAAGAYTFVIRADSRAFNPSGGDGGHLANWNYNPVYLYVTPSLSIAVV
jgi:hypothetical protein